MLLMGVKLEVWGKGRRTDNVAVGGGILMYGSGLGEWTWVLDRA